MRPASETHATYLARPSWRDRLVSSGITLALVALILLALLRMGAMPFRMPGDGRALSTFDVAPPGPKVERAEKQAERQQAAPKKAIPQRVTPPPPTPVPPPPPIELPGVIKLSRQDFNAANIANIPRADPGAGAKLAGGGGGDGRGTATGGGGGGGPNGETLYNAEWVREPTRAELATYMPRGQTGWGMIACRTVERNRVDDCQQIGETPGSGISRGVRQAAWQFLVRPPRVNGKPQIGAWVRIKIDLSEIPEK